MRKDFKILVERDEDGLHVVIVPALPGCVSQGRTEGEAKRNIAEAIKLHLGALPRDGVPLCPGRGAKEDLVAVRL